MTDPSASTNRTATRPSVLNLFRLDGKAAVVTGSGRGIGRAIALAFADAGADVVITARHRHEVAAVAAEVRDRGRRALEMPGDIRQAFVERLAQAAADEFGRLDIWVNNAGGSDESMVRPLTGVSDADFEAMLELNLAIPLSGSRAAAARMKSGGVIVNVASGAGMRAAPNIGAYGAAKAGLLNLTQTMAAELAGRSIRVNAVSPGMVPTESFFRDLELSEADLPHLVGTVPLGRLGTPDDIAAAVLYLASPAAGWVTGENLLIGGGREGGRSAEHR